MTAGTAVMSWAVLMTPAAAPNSLVLMGPVSRVPLPATGRATAWMAQMRPIACASPRSRPALLSITCAVLASVLTPARFAMGRRTATTTVTKKAVVRRDIPELFKSAVDLSLRKFRHL